MERFTNLINLSGNFTHKRLDYRVALIAQLLEHRSSNPRVVGLIPTRSIRFFNLFMGVCDEKIFVTLVLLLFLSSICFGIAVNRVFETNIQCAHFMW